MSTPRRIDAAPYVFPAAGLKRETWTEAVTTALFPRTWWDHFKERWFPGWLEARYPVRYQSFTLTTHHYHVCPHLPSDPKDEHLLFLVYEPERPERDWKCY
jgi:hypothetical protein